MNSRRATTLIEILMVTAVLGLILGMIGQAIVMGFRVHQATVRKTAAYRQATLAMARLFREISTCREWISPPTGTGWVTPTVTNKLAFYRNDRSSGTSFGAGVEVQYWYDPPSRQIRARDVHLPAGYRTVAREVEAFTVQVDDPVARVQVRLYGLETPVELSAQAPNM